MLPRVSPPANASATIRDAKHLGVGRERAQSAEEADDLQSAESLYRRVMNLDPNDPAPGLNLGNLLRVQHRTVEAEAAYRWAVKADPNFPPAWHNLADLHGVGEVRHLVGAIDDWKGPCGVLEIEVGGAWPPQPGEGRRSGG
jgi:tetratricopeptide (TPR) repeat protein